jgi:hypothetical protein
MSRGFFETQYPELTKLKRSTTSCVIKRSRLSLASAFYSHSSPLNAQRCEEEGEKYKNNDAPLILYNLNGLPPYTWANKE